jgi:c-di-GMP-binding flagellar brake protein YcgR
MDVEQRQDGEEPEELSRYQVMSRREIVSILRTLASSNQLITMQVDNGSEAVVTSVLGVDEASNFLFIDCARTAVANRRIADGERFSFDTTLDNIRISFSASSMQLCEYEGHDAFALAIPKSLLRLQRREFYRVPTPVVNPVRCTISFRSDESASAKALTFPLQNVSGGGIAIVDENKLLDDTIGRLYHDCKIDLPGGSLVIATLEVRNSREIKLTNGKTIRRVGCLFVDLPSAMLSAVQRYITKLERDQAARNKGLA